MREKRCRLGSITAVRDCVRAVLREWNGAKMQPEAQKDVPIVCCTHRSRSRHAILGRHVSEMFPKEELFYLPVGNGVQGEALRDESI